MSKNKGLFGVFCVTLVIVLTLCGQTWAITFANYQAALQGTTFPTHWRYLWNAPSDWDAEQGISAGNATDGAIGDSANYRELLWAEGYFWGPDGDNSGQNGAPGSFLRLSLTSRGHTGLGSSQSGGVNNTLDRYVIAAYTITEATVGAISITDSYLDRVAGPGKLDLKIYVNDILKL